MFLWQLSMVSSKMRFFENYDFKDFRSIFGIGEALPLFKKSQEKTDKNADSSWDSFLYKVRLWCLNTTCEIV